MCVCVCVCVYLHTQSLKKSWNLFKYERFVRICRKVKFAIAKCFFGMWIISS